MCSLLHGNMHLLPPFLRYLMRIKLRIWDQYHCYQFLVKFLRSMSIPSWQATWRITIFFSKVQNGFRKNHGTTDTVFNFLMSITNNLNITAVKLKETNRLETLLNTSLRVAYCVKNPIDMSRYRLHCLSKILPLKYWRKYFLLTID